MKKLIISLLLVGACRTSTTVQSTTTSTNPDISPGMTGASDAAGAVRGFMAAARQTDLQAMSALWGDKEGPARERLPRDELEKREIIMTKCLRHDSYEIAADAPAAGGGRAMVLNLTLGGVSRSTDFQVVPGPSQRWYVKEFDMSKLQEICMRKG